MIDKNKLVGMTVDIVSAYIVNNKISSGELQDLIRSTYKTLYECIYLNHESMKRREPMVPIDQSIFADYIICLEDGKQFKSLKRHLKTKYNMTPEQYREKWNLPVTYPMVAPEYAKARSRLAKEMGLGKARLAKKRKP